MTKSTTFVSKNDTFVTFLGKNIGFWVKTGFWAENLLLEKGVGYEVWGMGKTKTPQAAYHEPHAGISWILRKGMRYEV
jgi:hypothetical protein